MKLVKKLLRLLPLFLILFICISQLFKLKMSTSERHPTNTEIYTSYNYNNYYDSVCNQLDLYFGEVYQEIPFVANFNDTIIFDVLHFNGDSLNPTLLNTFLSTLWFELFLSLMFIIFDVFNFMLAIANKWISKGGNYD